jgi:hypothetical protein
MQELSAEKSFFDWLRGISSEYGETMAAWGQQVHDTAAANAGGDTLSRLAAATDTAVGRLVEALMTIGRRHEDPELPRGGADVIEALERLLGGSAELLREARAGFDAQGLAALAALSPRIAELRTLEAEVEQATARMSDRLEDTYGNPGKP